MRFIIWNWKKEKQTLHKLKISFLSLCNDPFFQYCLLTFTTIKTRPLCWKDKSYTLEEKTSLFSSSKERYILLEQYIKLSFRKWSNKNFQNDRYENNSAWYNKINKLKIYNNSKILYRRNPRPKNYSMSF